MHSNAAETPDYQSSGMDVSVPWWVVGVLVLGFIGLAVVTAGSNTLSIDLTVSDWVQSHDAQPAPFFGWIGDHLGGTKTGIGCLAAGFVVAIVLRSARIAWYLGIAAVLRLLATFLKEISDSPRPTVEQVEQLRNFESTGFPSGHATTATLVMGTLAYMVASQTDRAAARVLLLLVWALGVGVTGFARIWHGAHWLTDTIGGTLVGLIIVLVAANLSAAIMEWRSSGLRTSPTRTPTP